MKKVILLFMGMLLIFNIIGCNPFDSSSKNANLPELKDVGISEFDQILQEHKGKVILVNFFASWCPPCKAETPEFVETYNKLKDKNFVIIAFSIDDDIQKARQFVADYKITYPVYHAKRELEQKMGVSSIPTNIFYDKNGNLHQAMVGAITADFLINTYETLNK
ncbi:MULTISPECIES: TlpA family protein disulfide reductase [Calditerrivibrio]|uniref:TlpA family protein disulfide reductase n=1 Tax=Calditerrivibrio TaxID=545865 RepID=UPI003C7856AC